ncbi:glycosyltransferase family 4 protein [Desulfobacca acetoxidans]|nr:glycosyltransferase family 4 protein [Desulfobacca acetoxidans]
MKIIIKGTPHFVSTISEALKINYPEHEYIVIYSGETIKERIRMLFKYIYNIINADIIYIIWGKCYNRPDIKLALLLKKRVYMHWIGSDVITAKYNFNKNYYRNYNINNIYHLCETPWIQRELREIGIIADIVNLFSYDRINNIDNTLPDRFSILSYAAKGKELFYGLDKLIRLAKDFPEIEIRITNISDYDDDLPDNIKLLGRVPDIIQQYQDCVLYLRLIEHDGLSFSVLEALAHGRYVGYTYKFNNTIYIDSYITLRNVVNNLFLNFKNNTLAINQEGIDFIKLRFSSKVVSKHLIDRFMK